MFDRLKDLIRLFARHWLAVALGCVGVGIYFLFSTHLPYQARADTFVRDSAVMGLLVLFLWAPSFVYTPLTEYGGGALVGAVLAVAGALVGLFMERLWRSRRMGRKAAILLLVLNTAIGVFWVLATGIVVGPPFASCQRDLSDDVAVRAVAYPQIGNPGSHYFFLRTLDGGKTWEQFDYYYNDKLPSRVPPDCDAIQVSGQEVLWNWDAFDYTVLYSPDGGRIWEWVKGPRWGEQ